MTRWPAVPLGTILGGLEAGVSVNGTDEPVASSTEIGVLKVSCVSEGRFLPMKNKRVIDGDVKRVAVSPCEGDIVISRANTSDLVGASGYVDSNHPNLFLSDKLWRIRLVDEGSDPQWVIALLNSPQVRKALRQRATGTSGSMKNISKHAFLGIQVPYPEPKAQQRLGSVFSTIETILAGSKRLSFELGELKRSLAQQLLTGKKRFPELRSSARRQSGEFGTLPEDWRVVPISEVASEVSVRGAVDGAVVYSCTKHDGLVPSLEYFGKQVFSRNLDVYKRLAPGDFAYATNHIEEGSIGLVREGMKPGLVSPMYTAFRCDDSINPEFLYAVLKTESYRRVFERRTSASVNRRGSLRWRQFSKIRIPLPSRAEQDRIVETLDLVSREIGLLQEQQEQYQRYKRGLMSRLLSGEIQVPA